VTLDLVALAPRIGELVTALDHNNQQRWLRLALAQQLLERVENDRLDAVLDAARNANWLLARSEEPIGSRRQAPNVTEPYAALATDGSSIDVSRHAPLAYYLINIGHAFFDYRSGEVELDSVPELEDRSERLMRGDRLNASKESAMTGNLLDAYRTAREMLRLAELATERAGGPPMVALLDGQLVLWGLKESELSSSAQAEIFDEGVLRALTILRESAANSGLALASYISRPAGKEVTNSLRLLHCPRPGGVDCRDCPRTGDGGRPCDEVACGTDAELFAQLLSDGERSAIFSRRSISSDLPNADERYANAGHGLRFFYLRLLGGEVARVEIPEWVAASDATVDRLHAAVLDQCERGDGYPLVLQEAHEQAVIDGAARRTVASLLSREIERGGFVPETSGKSWSKRRRAI
jgi:NurA domain